MCKKSKVFNTECIESVTVYDIDECPFLNWRPASSYFFGLYKCEAGFYSNGGCYRYTAENLRNGEFYETKLIVIDNKAYYKPYVLIKFVSGDTKVRTFDTLDEAVAYSKEVEKLIPVTFS